MSLKVDTWRRDRIIQLKAIDLEDDVIAERLGISPRTVRVYYRAHRTGTKPYHPQQTVVDSSEEVQA